MATTTRRIVHFYHLNTEYFEEWAPTDTIKFRAFFNIIARLAQTKDPLRYQRLNGRGIFVQDVFFDDKTGADIITGKLRSVRQDALPEIMNTEKDEVKGIEILEQEGIVETTHFVIKFNLRPQSLAFEFNMHGAKIIDFLNYCNIIGHKTESLKAMTFQPVVRNELISYKSRINRCSKLLVKVHKNNIPELAKVDGALFQTANKIQDQLDSEYAEIVWNFDYKQRSETKEANNLVTSIIDKLTSKKEYAELFNKLEVTAEDSEHNNRLEVFDLLANKVTSKLKVEQKINYRTLISEDMFAKMRSAMNHHRI